MAAIRLFRLTPFLALTLFCLAIAPGTGLTQSLPDLYFVDAHSQLPAGQSVDEIIPLMDRAGVRHTILSARNDRKPKDIADLAEKHPDRITAAVRSKGKAFTGNRPQLKKLIGKQIENPVFRAMAEAILYHAQKGQKAPLMDTPGNSPQAQMLLEIAVQRGWPFIAHYEFAAAGWSKSGYMSDFEDLLRAHPDHPFVLIHMGQLDLEDAARLIGAHANVHFIMSHSNPVTIAKSSGQPWTNLFDGDRLKPAWRDLILRHPDRFILGFDNVWPEHWSRYYLDQAALWRRALAELPAETAHILAHGNAERLWKLPVK